MGTNDEDIAREYYPNGTMRVEIREFPGYLVRRSWFENGKQKGELFAVGGLPCGRVRSWDESGDLTAEQYFIHGKRASKKKYQDLQKSDSTLPPIEDDDQVAWADSVEVGPANPATITLSDFPAAKDALEWLRTPLAEGVRTLGELPTSEESTALVLQFIHSGAESVWIPEISIDEEGDETASQVLVVLPKTKSKRRAVLSLCNEFNQSAGFAPVSDQGQDLVQVVLD